MLIGSSRRRNSGMILVTVAMIVMVLSIFATSILSQNLNQSSVAKSQLDAVVAQQLAKGAYWKVYGDMLAGGAPVGIGTVNLNGKAFSVSADGTRPPNSTTDYRITVAY